MLLIHYAELLREQQQIKTGKFLDNKPRTSLLKRVNYLLETICQHPDTFLIPRLLKIVEQHVDKKVLWINDSQLLPQYRQVHGVIFVGLHPSTNSPFVFNYISTTQIMELNFQLGLVWNCVKTWIHKDRLFFDPRLQRSHLAGNHILTFNGKAELIDVNEYIKEELDPYFSFPAKIDRPSDLHLKTILKSPELYDTICQVVEDLEDTAESCFEIPQPQILVSLNLEPGRSRGFSLIIKPDVLTHALINKSLAALHFAMTPISFIKAEESDNESILPDNYSLLRKEDKHRMPNSMRVDEYGGSVFKTNYLKSKYHGETIRSAAREEDKLKRGKSKKLTKLRSQFSQDGTLLLENPPFEDRKKSNFNRRMYGGATTAIAMDVAAYFKNSLKLFDKDLSKSIAKEYVYPEGEPQSAGHLERPKNKLELTPMIVAETQVADETPGSPTREIYKLLERKQKSSHTSNHRVSEEVRTSG